MIQEILNAVTAKLDDLFDFENNFTDEVPQGTSLPYTFTTITPSPLVKRAGDRYEQSVTVSVIAEIENTPTMFDDLRDMATKLEDGLEYLTLSDGSKMRGDNFHTNTSTGILDFNVDYSYFIRKIKDKDETMDTVTTNVAVND